MNTLKTSLKVWTLAALLGGGGLVALQTGCAATPTKESTGEFVDDSTITTKVKAAFIHDEFVKSSDISVETFKGVVQLSGFVDKSEQKSAAGRDASNVPNVRDVRNDLIVK